MRNTREILKKIYRNTGETIEKHKSTIGETLGTKTLEILEKH